jgi:hypothetical protein
VCAPSPRRRCVTVPARGGGRELRTEQPCLCLFAAMRMSDVRGGAGVLVPEARVAHTLCGAWAACIAQHVCPRAGGAGA